MQWLFWQMGGLGPMLGQHLHFSAYAPERLDYAIERYAAEAERLYGVLDRRLAGREYIAGDYTIADMASFPWVHRLAGDAHALDAYPNLRRWHDAIAARLATTRAYARGAAVNTTPTITAVSKKLLFGQGAARRAA